LGTKPAACPMSLALLLRKTFLTGLAYFGMIVC
jgi:hypothetical protein